MESAFEQSESGKVAWYCARTQPKHEHIAAGGLCARLGLEVFNPRLRMERSTRRGLVRVIEPLFPCYIFVRCDLREKADVIRHVTGISSLVHFGHRIPPVPEEVIEELRQCFELDEPMGVQDGLRAGSEVVVLQGPLLGSRGLVVRALPGRERVQILLEFLGRTTLTEIERGAVAVENRRMADLVPLLANEGLVERALAG